MTGVWVTGIGLTTGLDRAREWSWYALAAGRSAFCRVPAFRGHAGAPADSAVDGRILALVDRVCLEALHDASLADWPASPGLSVDPNRVATIVGLSKGDVQNQERVNQYLNTARPDDYEGIVNHAWRAGLFPNAAAWFLMRRWKLGGPCLAPVAACATGLVAALQGADLIRLGACDVAICGASDVSLDEFLVGAFRKMKALAPIDGDLQRAVRPWHRARSGFLIGEGAAVLILESDSHARARGVLPYAEFAGGALGSDAYHITDLNPDPSGLARVIGLAMKKGEMAASDLDYINVHGTATRQNDPLECRAIRKALGAHAESVSCSANKAQIGHMLGAAGAAELAITCLAMRDGFVPPTLNLDDPDPACDLDGTPHVGKNREIRAALKLSIGFGGHLAAAVLRRPDGARRSPLLHPFPQSRHE